MISYKIFKKSKKYRMLFLFTIFTIEKYRIVELSFPAALLDSWFSHITKTDSLKYIFFSFV